MMIMIAEYDTIAVVYRVVNGRIVKTHGRASLRGGRIVYGVGLLGRIAIRPYGDWVGEYPHGVDLHHPRFGVVFRLLFHYDISSATVQFVIFPFCGIVNDVL